MKKVKIYALIEPTTKKIRYIGKTAYALNVRLSQHLRDTNSKTHKFKWINSLKKNNLKPEIILIEEVDEDSWIEKERMYISLFKSLGYKLTNTSDGGEGGGSKGHKHSDDFKKKQSDMMKERNKNNPLPKEFYFELAKNKRKAILKLDKNGCLISEYKSTYEAAESIVGTNKSAVKKAANTITNSLKGRSKSAHGFAWKYKLLT